LSPGFGGIVGGEIKAALSGMKDAPQIYNVAIGLGGRDVPLEMWPRLLDVPKQGGGFRILDLEPAKLGEMS